jgi:hypothetical protein
LQDERQKAEAAAEEGHQHVMGVNQAEFGMAVQNLTPVQAEL